MEGQVGHGIFTPLNTVQSLYNTMLESIGMNCVISEQCLTVITTILQRNRKMTMLWFWSLSYNSFVKFQGKKIWSHNMTMLYPKSVLY